MKIRDRKIVAAGLVLLGLHILALAMGWALVSALVELGLAALAGYACMHTAASSPIFENRFWRLVGWGMWIYALGQALVILYDNVLHAPFDIWWPSDVVFLFSMAPIAMTLFLDPDAPKIQGSQLLDFLQIGVVTSAAYLFFLYAPLRTHPGDTDIGLTTWYVSSGRDALVTVAFLLRASFAGSKRLRALFGRVAVFLLLFSVGEYLYLWQQEVFDVHPGGWWDLAWSLPRFYLILGAATWDPTAEEAVDARPAPRSTLRTLVTAQVAHVALPLLVLGMAQSAVQRQFTLAAIAVCASFACSGARLLLSQREQDRALIALDSTGRSLQQAEEKYRLLFERNRAGVFRSTPEGRILDCNQAFVDLFGYTREELVGQPSYMLYPGGKADRDARVAQLRQEGRFTNYEICYQHKDGRPLWVIQNVTLTQDAAGSPLIEGTLVDITERKLAEKEITEWKERYDAAVLASGQIIYDWDPTTRLAVFGGSVRTVLGYDPEHFATDPDAWRALIHPDDLGAYAATMQLGLQTMQPFELEYRVRRRDGSYSTVRENGRVEIDPRSKAPHMVGFLLDISERRQLEQQLRQAQKMEAVGRLSGGVAHDFNNLLTVIKGYSEMQLESVPASDPLHHSAGEIKAAADRAASLTQQLLAFSRQQILQPRTLDLNQVVSDLGNMLRRLIGEDIEMRTVLDQRLGPVRADPGQMEQILLNLAVNARDAMPNGGKLTIETANVRLSDDYVTTHSYVPPGDYVRVAVSDTGTGMDAATMARVFEPFFTTKEVGKGTGLGLSTVYGIVKQSGGHVEVYSEPGRGTTFKVYLPRVREATSSTAPAAAKPRRVQGGETILVVEDDPQLRSLAKAALLSNGYKVLLAEDGEELAAICEPRDAAIDLLLTDVVMPKLSGKEISARVTRRFPAIKTLYMSGYTANAIVHHGVLDDGIFFLQKPFTPTELAAKVREVLDQPPGARP